MKICQQLILFATLVNRIVGTSDDIPARNDPKAEGAIAKVKALGLLIPGIRGKIPKDDTGKASEGVKENKVFDKDAPTLQQAHLRSDGGSEGRAGVGDCWSHDVGERCWRDCDCKSNNCPSFYSTCVECQHHQSDCGDDKYCDKETCLPKKDGGATCTMMEQCKSNLCDGAWNKLWHCLCRDKSDCAKGEYCDKDTGACAEGDCFDDMDCVQDQFYMSAFVKNFPEDLAHSCVAFGQCGTHL